MSAAADLDTDAPAVTTDDTLNRVHHHCPYEHAAAALAGHAVPALCGYVKPIDPDAADKPCCPLCAAELERDGERCSGRPLSRWFS